MFTVRNRTMSHATREADALDSFHPGEHARCVALSSRCRGKLCDDLARRPARHLAAGEFIYRMGDAARSVYLVRHGLVKTAGVSPGGQEPTLRIHPPGDVFGELCLCSGERREHAIALEASEVVAITLEMLLARLREDPLAALDLTSVACEHLAEANDRLRSLSIDSALHRLARTLLGLAADLGEPMPDGMLVLRYITQQELARLVGARREVASGLLNRRRRRALRCQEGPRTHDAAEGRSGGISEVTLTAPARCMSTNRQQREC
jgi:CRP/FNR family cyclic AMP-dependent transcriptional regulator